MLEGHVGPGILQGNPFHEDLLEIVARVGADFLCDVTIDRMRRMTGVYAGDVVQAHLAGAEALEQQVLVTLPESVDIVLTSAGGYPLDQTLYQAIKGLVAALNIVRPGGAIVLVAELSEGAGSAEFVRLLLSASSPDAFMEQLLQPGFFQVDQWMVQHLCQVLRKASVWIVSRHKVVEFPDGFAIRWAASAEAALAEIKERFPQARSVAVIPEGPYTLPTVRGVKMPLGAAWKQAA
jgi:nickel-dependent lactate racemase